LERLDRASFDLVMFVARRLAGTHVALVLTADLARDIARSIRGVTEIELHGFAIGDATRLLEEAVPGTPIDADVRERLVADTGGNPGGLVDAVHAMTKDELEGASPLPDPIPLGASMRETGRRRLAHLPADTRLLLLLLAAADTPLDTAVLERAAARLGVPPTALRAAEEESLIRVGVDASFIERSTRAAVYALATADERHIVHGALAHSMEAEADADRRAWHGTVGVVGPDEALAAGLERTAEAAGRRDGFAVRAGFLARAAELTSDPVRRTRRALEAVASYVMAGKVPRAAAILQQLGRGSLGVTDQARVRALTASLALSVGRTDGNASALLESADAIDDADPDAEGSFRLMALESATWAGRLGSPGVARDVAAAARSGLPDAERRDALSDGLAALTTRDHVTAAPALRRAFDSLGADDLRWLGLAGYAASELWDEDAMRRLAARRVQLARETGAGAILPHALIQLGGYDTLVGRLDVAELRLLEAERIGAAARNRGTLGGVAAGRLLVHVWRGDETMAAEAARECEREATASAIGLILSFVSYATAVLELSLGRYATALTAAEEACDRDAFWVATRTLPDLVEAAARSGERDAAVAALRRLEPSVTAGRSQWGAGILARSRALVESDDDAEALYREAIVRLGRSSVAPELARARLVFGEWLRRRRRPRDARAELRASYAAFRAMGARAFAERARVELLATGEHAEPIAASAADVLTPQERRIALLARDGDSNSEIAAKLFISRYTVEYHLKKVFSKLGIASRTELSRALPD
ncbi:MAG: LuxR C-terminal-related transcriptional regulator, partial [Actinomycetota bacterium]